MGKFYGAIGFYIKDVESKPGIWTNEIIERNYSGDMLRNNNKFQNGEHLNSNFTIDSRFSIVSDPFACENFQAIRYIRYLGTKWIVTSADIQRPRIILTTGGVYNGETPDVSSDTD